MPTVAYGFTTTVPSASEPVIAFDLPLDVADGDWLVLRISDGVAATTDPRAPASYAPFGRAIAYASPFFFEPPASS